MRISLRPEVVGRAAPPILSLLATTWRVDRKDYPRYASARASGRPVLILAWHETLLPLLLCHQREGIAVVVSEAPDGAYLAHTAARFGYRAIGGSSTRGRLKAMRGMLHTLQQGGTVAVTPDGPRGPRRVLKTGALLAAQRAGALVISMFATARPSWRYDSWDRFMVPAPFAKVRVAYGQPFEVGSGDDALLEARQRATGELRSLEKEVSWPDGAVPIA